MWSPLHYLRLPWASSLRVQAPECVAPSPEPDSQELCLNHASIYLESSGLLAVAVAPDHQAVPLLAVAVYRSLLPSLSWSR